MAFDSSTLCARTSAGDAELATPNLGLALGQRRVLGLLRRPVAVDELAQEHRLEPEKLARDLTRLAELQLIELHGPTIAPMPLTATSAPGTRVPESMAPVVIGNMARRSPTLPIAAGAAALVLASGIWYGTRAGESATAAPKPNAAVPSPQSQVTTPSPALPVASTANDAAPAIAPPVALAPSDAPVASLSGISTVLRGNVAPPELRPAIRPGLPSAEPGPPKPSGVAMVAEPREPARRDATGNGPTVAPAASAPPSGPNTAADAAPPVQIAAAKPTASAPPPAATAALKAISREPPDFPKEAIADGFKSGNVSARIHVDARGNVTGVDVLDSQPPKVFDRAVRRALMRWQFEPNAAGHASDLDVDVKFQRD